MQRLILEIVAIEQFWILDLKFEIFYTQNKSAINSKNNPKSKIRLEKLDRRKSAL